MGLDELLGVAQGALNELPALGADSRVPWLERQLAQLVAQVQALMADVDAGCSLSELGFFSAGEFEEMLNDLAVEVANLKGMIQTARMLGR